MVISSYLTLIPQAAMQRTETAITRSLQRLSTGKQVNYPWDDEAALNESVTLDSQIRGLNQVQKNTNDAVGLLETADSAVSSQLDILQRMREIAVEASNGTLETTDRTSLNSELQQLMSEFSRITSSTNFNGINLLDGTFGTQSLQVGSAEGDTYSISIPSFKASSLFLQTVGNGQFASRTTSTVGTGPKAMAIADLNGDGSKDIVSADAGSGTLSILLGYGNGTFKTRTTVSVGTTPIVVKAADLLGNGIQDLLTADASGSISILMGNGDGTFKARTTIATGNGPTSIAVGDLNGDGKQDIVTADSTDGTVSIMLGNGDGTFQSRTTVAVGTSPQSVKLVDINGDGMLDIVTANSGSANVSVLLGNGNGTFQSAVNTTVGTTPTGLDVVDLNHDGHPDVVTSNAGSANVSVLMNSGNGTLGTATNYTVGTTPDRVRVGDINGDGNVDIVSEDTGSLTLSLLTGNGDGTFNARTTLATSGSGANGPIGLDLSDLNNDGVLDIVTADYTNNTGSTISYYQGRTQSISAQSSVTVATQSQAQSLIAIVDSAISGLNTERASVGALHSRLEETTAYVLATDTSLQTARSSVVDADLAKETADLTRNQILQQAQIAAFSQANIAEQTVLYLLRANNYLPA